MPDRRVRRETRTVEEVFDAHDALGTEALAGGLEAATRLWDRASGGMLSRDASDHAPVEPLSGQERGIQTLLAGGKEPATIAQQLGISGQTLRNHLHHINWRLRTHNWRLRTHNWRLRTHNRLVALTHTQRRG